MDIKEKRLLFEYVKLHKPVWEITEWHGKGKSGIYKFWAFISSTWSDIIGEKGISIVRYGYNEWEVDDSKP